MGFSVEFCNWIGLIYEIPAASPTNRKLWTRICTRRPCSFPTFFFFFHPLSTCSRSWLIWQKFYSAARCRRDRFSRFSFHRFQYSTICGFAPAPNDWAPLAVTAERRNKPIKTIFFFEHLFFSHITRTGGWLPPAESWGPNIDYPYGWEKAIDGKGRTYYIKYVFYLYKYTLLLLWLKGLRRASEALANRVRRTHDIGCDLVWCVCGSFVFFRSIDDWWHLVVAVPHPK